MGVGGRRRLCDGLDLRPHPLGRHARWTVARRRTRPGCCGRGDAAGEARDLGGVPQLPAPRATGPRRARPGRRERGPVRPGDRAGQRGPRCHRTRATALELDRTDGSLRGVPAHPAGDPRWRRGRPHDHHRPLLRRRGHPQHTGGPASSLPTDHRRRRPARPRPGRRLRPAVGDDRSGVGYAAHARGHPARRTAAVRPAGRGLQRKGAGRRDVATLRKVLLWTPTETILTSRHQFDELAAPYEELGFDEFVLHHPAQSGPYGGSVPVFEQIAAGHAADAR